MPPRSHAHMSHGLIQGNMPIIMGAIVLGTRRIGTGVFLLVSRIALEDLWKQVSRNGAQDSIEMPLTNQETHVIIGSMCLRKIHGSYKDQFDRIKKGQIRKGRYQNNVGI
ncbi:hypothetical protein Bca52824_001235 [Brassica carinata]|uniref:Uncharacterized protein n=1 Tax=Brassica carinata TaxID=52824 RepID=A0A8X8BCI7_BRACI|nr:hypothetical protein Bca52824_001235 [Brassica carinata]